MAKGDQEKTMKDIADTRKTNEGNYNDYLANVKEQGKGLNQQGQTERSNILANANNFASTGGITPEAAQRLRDAGNFGANTKGPNEASSGGGGGTYYQPQSGNPYAMNGGQSAFNSLGPSAFNNVNWDFKDARDQVKSVNPIADELSNLNASRYKDVQGQVGRLNDFASTGGMTQDDYNKINRDNFYEFEKTGGYSDPQLADIRGRSNSTLPSFYNNLQDQMKQNRLKSGGYNGAAFDASSAKLARMSAQGAAEQARNTEVDIADRVRAGKMDASKTIAQNQLGLLGIMTPQKQQALSNAANTSLGLAGVQDTGLNYGGGLRLGAGQALESMDLNDAQISLAKAKGIDDYTINVATGKDRYATAEDQIAAQERIANAGIAASAGSSRYATDRAFDAQQAALNSTNERFLIGSQQQGQEYGMGQAGNMYGQAYGPQEAFNKDYLAGIQGLGGYDQSNLQLQGQEGQLAGKWATGFQNAGKVIGSIAGGMTGLSAIGGAVKGIQAIKGAGSAMDGASNGWWA